MTSASLLRQISTGSGPWHRVDRYFGTVARPCAVNHAVDGSTVSPSRSRSGPTLSARASRVTVSARAPHRYGLAVAPRIPEPRSVRALNTASSCAVVMAMNVVVRAS